MGKGGCHRQKEQPRGHHPAHLNTTRAHLGKQPPFPLTRGCPVGGWLAGWHRTHVLVLGLPDCALTPKQTERCKRSNYPHGSEEEVSRKVTHWRGLLLREVILPTTSLGRGVLLSVEPSWAYAHMHSCKNTYTLSLAPHACTQASPKHTPHTHPQHS